MRMILKAMGAALVATTLGLTGSAVAQQEPIKVTVAYDGFTMTSAPMQYALKEGIFEKHGLDVELMFVEGGSVLTQALVGGSVDIAQNGYIPVLTAAVSGADVVVIGGIANTLPMMLVVDASIKSADDLRGKAIAISRYGSSTDVAARFALEALELTTSDVNILQLGGEGTRLAAYMSGQVNGIMVQLPGAQDLLDEGANLLVDVGQIATDYPNTAYATTRSFLKDNPDTVKRFYMAMAEALHQYRANPEKAMQITAEFMQTEQRPNLQKAVEYYANSVYQMDLRPSVGGMKVVLEELGATVPAALTADPEALVDSTILDALHQEGFFQTLQ